MAATDSNKYFTKLDTLYQKIDSLTPASPAADFAVFGAFFDEACTTYLKSMREFAEPSHGRAATIASLQEVLQQQHYVERKILSRSIATSPDSENTTVFVETKNKLHVLGKKVDTFYETAVVTFDSEGLITELKNYSCRSPVVETIQQETGKGPYSEEYVSSLKTRDDERVAGCCG